MRLLARDQVLQHVFEVLDGRLLLPIEVRRAQEELDLLLHLRQVLLDQGILEIELAEQFAATERGGSHASLLPAAESHAAGGPSTGAGAGPSAAAAIAAIAATAIRARVLEQCAT